MKRDRLPPLERKCPACNGTGHCEGEKCIRCNGCGRAPTEFGEQIVDLIRNHLSAILDRVLNDKI